MKEIKLTKNQVTQVDDWWYNFLMQWKWFAAKGVNTYYAVRRAKKIDGAKYYNRPNIYMHTVIFGYLKPDHKDRNGLNNQEHNLRKATRSQNAINSIKQNKTNYRGVYYNSRSKRFMAMISINGKQKSLGAFDTPITAAKAHDHAALKYQGEFAILNFKLEL